MPGADSIDLLTDGERECLRMVLDHLQSKEIALVLGIGPDAVDKRIKQAMRKLGVSSRVIAARMLAEHERPDRYQRLVYQPDPLENDAESGSWMIPQPEAEPVVSEFREERMTFDIPVPEAPGGPAGGKHDRSLYRRIAIVMASVLGIAILAALVASGLLSAILAGQQALEHTLN